MCSDDLPEVEIFSLLEEQIPRYKLRADSLTTFAGYENQDWFIPAPALRPEEQEIPLTPDQIRETLNYFSKFFWINELRVLNLRGKYTPSGVRVN